jgi:hypothetical protein
MLKTIATTSTYTLKHLCMQKAKYVFFKHTILTYTIGYRNDLTHFSFQFLDNRPKAAVWMQVVP